MGFFKLNHGLMCKIIKALDKGPIDNALAMVPQKENDCKL